jgi:hypothetical protein
MLANRFFCFGDKENDEDNVSYHISGGLKKIV